MSLLRTVLFAAVAAASLTTAASADTYTKADFSGAIYSGNANVRSPFSGNGFTQGDTFSGSFVFDDQDVPGSGSGYVNIFTGNFPDAIPGADAFSLNLDGLSFTGSDNINALLYPSGGIQYNNGQFNGFVFVSDFQFQGNFYQFQLQGPTFTVYALDGDVNAYGDPHGYPTGQRLIGGYINGGLTNETAYVPPVVVAPGVPEPATWAMFLLGFGTLGVTLRVLRRKGAISVA